MDKRLIYYSDDGPLLYRRYRSTLSKHVAFDIFIVIAGYLIIGFYTRANFYWVALAAYVLLSILAAGAIHADLARRIVKFEDFDLGNVLCEGCSCRWARPKMEPPDPYPRRILRWRALKIGFWFLNFGFWFFALYNYTDAVGITTGAFHSPCTSGNVTGTTAPYNYFGYFVNTVFAVRRSMAFCTNPYVTWANPSYDGQLYGYVESPLGENGVPDKDGRPEYCAGARVPASAGTGYISKLCREAYATPHLGLIGGVGDVLTSAKVYPCGNTNLILSAYVALPTCVGPNGEITMNETYALENDYHCVAMTPKPLCPVCLNFWRMMSGQFTGPSDAFKSCPAYDPTQGSNLFCAFCAGLGFGFNAQMRYKPEEMVTSFWLVTLYLIIYPFVEFFLYLGTVNAQHIRLRALAEDSLFHASSKEEKERMVNGGERGCTNFLWFLVALGLVTVLVAIILLIYLAATCQLQGQDIEGGC